MSLEKIITELQAMRKDMQDLGKSTLPDLNALEYIKTASLRDCKELIDALIDRVSDLVGEAGDLEDASHKLSLEIEAQEPVESD